MSLKTITHSKQTQLSHTFVLDTKERDGVTHSDPKVQSEILNDQFESVFTPKDSTVIPSKRKSPYPDLPHISPLSVMD